MTRWISSLLIVALSACSAQDSAPRGDVSSASAEVGSVEPSPATDSSMVVPTEARVPSDGPPTVVFLGTSLTAGLGLERDEDTYVSVLAELADSAGMPIRVVNAGVSGDTSAGGLRRLDWLLRTPVDVLFLELGANDGLRGQDPAATRENLEEIVRRTRAAYPDVRIVLAGMEAPTNLGERYTAAFREIFPEVAGATGSALVPFLLEGVAGVDSLNQEDRIHPTPTGHRLIARTVWPVLHDVLMALPDPDPDSDGDPS